MPVSARGAFGVHLDLAVSYVDWLAGEGIVRGLIGPREVPRLWDRHVLNSVRLGSLLPHGASVCDVGSGAGLPGLVVAIARPDLSVTLLEPLLRRTTFLDEVVADLGIADRVTVVRARAEEMRGERSFDVVTSRAVAPLGRLLHWSMPLVSPRGSLLALKGERAAEEIEEAKHVWRYELPCREPEVVVLEPEPGGVPLRVVRVAWADPARVRLPPAPGSRPTGAARTSARKRRRPR